MVELFKLCHLQTKMGSGVECLHPHTKDDSYIVTSCRQIIAHSDETTKLKFGRILKEHQDKLRFKEVEKQREQTTNSCAMKYGACRWF